MRSATGPVVAMGLWALVSVGVRARGVGEHLPDPAANSPEAVVRPLASGVGGDHGIGLADGRSRR